MRKLIVLIALLVSVTCFGQKPLTYSVVIQQDSTSAQKLYEMSKSWFAKEYVNSQKVLQNDNPGKEISGKARIELTITSLKYAGLSGYISYFIDLEFRDNRLKVTMTDFCHDPTRSVMYDNQMGVVLDSLPDDLKTLGGKFEKGFHRTFYKSFWEKAKPLCALEFHDVTKSLSDFLKAKRNDEKKDNW